MSKSLAAFVQTSELPALSENQISDALSEITGDSVQSNIQYMSFSGKTGNYAMGRDRDEPGDELFIVEPQSVVEGWVCWKGQRPIDRIEWSVYERAKAKVDLEQLPDHSPYRESAGEGWNRLLGFGSVGTARYAETDQSKVDDVHVKFTTTSTSGRNAVQDLLSAISDRAASGEPHIPVIEYSQEQFEAQEQKNWKPKFEIKAWIERASGEAFMAGNMSLDDLLAGKKPKKNGKRK